MEINESFHEEIGRICIECFTMLPKSGKPNLKEWTVLSCIVLEFKSELSVVALGTGSKCIGKNKMSNSGIILNDSHAEVICRRSFLRFLYHQMKETKSLLHFNEEIKKYSIDGRAKFHFFTTNVPCGDAAIFAKNHDDLGEVISEDNTGDIEVPCKKIKIEDDFFRTGAKCLEGSREQDLKLEGREYHVPGVVRTKPGRGNATLSVSCSDKLSKWCHLGVQGALLSLLLDKPVYLSSLTFTVNTQYCKKALSRALYDRLGNFQLNGTYKQTRMVVGVCQMKFEFFKDNSKQPCSSSVSWCKVKEKCLEVAVEGKRQGVTKKHIDSSAGRLKICKLELFKVFLEICKLRNLKLMENNYDINALTYRDVKMLATDFQNSWTILRERFKMWTFKEEELLNFIVK